MAEPPLRILLVEDDPAYAELTRAMLTMASGTAMTLDHATSVHAAVDKLADQTYDTVLLDLGLPDAQELEALNSLVGAAPDLPLVILTSTENEVLALQAVKGGAQDYLIKGQATPELLVRAVRYAIERKQSELHIRHLAYYDPLTQLPNRRLLIEHLGGALQGVGHVVVVGTTGSGKSWSTSASAVGAQPDRPSLAELVKQNAALRFEQWQQAVRESFSTAELEQTFGVSRQRLEQLRKQDKLLGFQPPFERGFFYPVWEFDDQGRPSPHLPALIAAANEAQLDALSLHQLMVSETTSKRGPLMTALRAGDIDYVLDVVRASSDQGS